MSLTIEEIQAAVKENPELEAKLVAYSTQTEAGRTLLNNHLSNNKEAISKAAADEATKNAYGHLDSTLKDLGYEKQEGEKSTAAAARAIKELKAQIAKASTSEEGKEDAKKMIEAIKLQADKEKEDLLAQLETERNNNKTNNIKSSLINARAGFKYNPNYDQVVLDKFVEDAEQQLIKSAKKQDNGTFIYHDKEGMPYLNQLRAPATAKEVLTLLLKPVLAVSDAGGGAGQEKPSGKVIDGNIKLSGSFSSQVELNAAYAKAAAAQGWARGSEEYKEQWDVVKKQHNYADLKRK